MLIKKPFKKGMGPSIAPYYAAAAGGFSLTFQDQAVDNTQTTFNFGTKTYGSGNTRVIIALGFIASTARTISSVTVNGVSFTQVPSAYATQGNFGSTSDVWISNTSITGSSGNVTVVFSGLVDFGVSMALYNLQTATPAVSAANNVVSGFSGSIAQSIAVPAGGGAVVVTGINNAHTATFTNAAVDATITPSAGLNYYAHTTTTGSVTVTATLSGGDQGVMSLVSWAP